MTNNREILFRGFHPCEDGDTTIYIEGEAVQGRWVEGSLIFFSDGDSYICCEDIASDSLSKYEVIPPTVGQYTGVTDKHGMKIYEGDVIKYLGYSEYTIMAEVKIGEYMQDGSGGEYSGSKCIGTYCKMIDSCHHAWADDDDYPPDELNTVSPFVSSEIGIEVIGTIFDNRKKGRKNYD